MAGSWIIYASSSKWDWMIFLKPDVTHYALLLITWRSLRLKSPAIGLCVQLYAQAKMQCKFSTLPAFNVGKPPVAPGWPRQIASNSGNVPISRRQHVCECIGFVAIATDMCEKGVPPSTHRIWWAEEPQPMFTDGHTTHVPNQHFQGYHRCTYYHTYYYYQK